MAAENITKEEFLRRIQHELNNRLCAVIGNLSFWLADSESDDATKRAVIEDALAAAEEAAHYVKQLTQPL